MSSQAPAQNASAKPEEQKPSAPAAPSAAQVAPKEKNPFEGDVRYEQFKVVRMRLLKEGTIQYDPNYPELVLNSTDEKGQFMPLTPFFSSRINQTLELVL